MQAMNKAIEDASDYMEFQRKLENPALRRQQQRLTEAMRAEALRAMGEPASEGMGSILLGKSPRRPGENREQHRARLRGERV